MGQNGHQIQNFDALSRQPETPVNKIFLHDSLANQAVSDATVATQELKVSSQPHEVNEIAYRHCWSSRSQDLYLGGYLSPSPLFPPSLPNLPFLSLFPPPFPLNS